MEETEKVESSKKIIVAVVIVVMVLAAIGISLFFLLPPPSEKKRPSAPTNVVATAGDGRVTITWDSVEGADSYNLYWDTTSVSSETGTKIEGVTSPYEHTGLDNGVTYYYVVTAVNEAGESDDSAMVSATPEKRVLSSMQIVLNPSSVTAGNDAGVVVTTYDQKDEQFYEPTFSVRLDVFGRDHFLSVDLTDGGDGTYTGTLSINASGTYSVVAYGVNGTDGSKWLDILLSKATLTVSAGQATELDVSFNDVGCGPIRIFERDSYGNLVPNPSPTDITLESNNPNITVGSIGPDPESPDYGLTAPIIASYWDNATINVTMGSVTKKVEVVCPPASLILRNATGEEGMGFPMDSDFSAVFAVDVPADAEPILSFDATVEVSDATLISFLGCQALDPTITVVCSETAGVIDITANATVEITGFMEALQLNFMSTTGAVGAADMSITSFIPFNITARQIFYMVELFMPLWVYPLVIKPIKTLDMHIYVVEGEATVNEVLWDVMVAENSFNLNALLCTLDFYISFNVEITTIPAANWSSIDEDNDGLDRWDSNGDGDYDDANENDDLQNAKDEGFYDNDPNTENIYYVPSIRGGAIGTTYAPDRQVAIDNGADPDDFTLFHEKVHELDLRKDGDFDVKDSPDDAGNAQGARNPGNVMNYDDMGPALTRPQASQLDP